MKKTYIEPKAVRFFLDVESPLCAATPVGANIVSDQYENVYDKPVNEGGSDLIIDRDPAITAKGYDYIWEENDDE